MKLVAHLIATREGLMAQRGAWQHLSQTVPENTTVCATWEFITTYVSVLRPNNWIVVAVSVEGQDTPIGIFPLLGFTLDIGEKQMQTFRPIDMMDSSYTEFLVSSQCRVEAFETLFKVLRDRLRCDAFLVGHMHEQSSNYYHLLETTPSNRVVVFSKPGLPNIDASTIDAATFMRRL